MSLLEGRFVGCLVGSVVGDSLGASFEGLWVRVDIESVDFHGRWSLGGVMVLVRRGFFGW